MSVIIITDSACDIDLKERSRLRVETIGIRVFFGEDTYLEGENMTAAQFYGMLAEAAELPKTAQITPLEFEERIPGRISMRGMTWWCCPCPRNSAVHMAMPSPLPRSSRRDGCMSWIPSR